MFWKKKSELSKKNKKVLLEDIKTLRNHAVILTKELDNLRKYVEGLE